MRCVDDLCVIMLGWLSGGRAKVAPPQHHLFQTFSFSTLAGMNIWLLFWGSYWLIPAGHSHFSSLSLNFLSPAARSKKVASPPEFARPVLHVQAAYGDVNNLMRSEVCVLCSDLIQTDKQPFMSAKSGRHTSPTGQNCEGLEKRRLPLWIKMIKKECWGSLGTVSVAQLTTINIKSLQIKTKSVHGIKNKNKWKDIIEILLLLV